MVRLSTWLAIAPALIAAEHLALAQNIEAYADRTSVVRGQAIAFSARDVGGHPFIDSLVNYTIHRVGPDESALASGFVGVRYRSVPSAAYQNGCAWPTTLSFTVPTSWAPGLYTAHFGAGTNSESYVDFVVRPSSPTANILLQVPFTTRAAYNNYGGKSLYDSGSGGAEGSHADRVSLDRPDRGVDNRVYLAKEFIRWAEGDGGEHGPYAMDFISSVDLHADPSIPGAYQLFLTVGHDEYWSRPMRDHLDNFVRAGGNAAIFSGNTMYYQIRFEDDGSRVNRRIVCYKDFSDPISSVLPPDPAAAAETVKWDEIGHRSNLSIGLGFRAPLPLGTNEGGGGACCGVNHSDFRFKVVRDSSWVFAGTGLSNGSFFGGEIMGYETDALVFNRLTNTPTGIDQSPNNFQILARANLLDPTQWDPEGWAILGLFDYGGTVFNVGTVDWADGLTDDHDDPHLPVIAEITENVLTRLSAARTATQKNTLSVHRYAAPSPFGGTKFYFSTSPFVESGWEYDGFAFFAHRTDTSATVPLYRYYAADGGGYRYHYSLSATVGSGWTLEGPAFYVYATSGTGRVPVYEYYAAQSGGGYRFLYSTDSTITSGWTFNGVAFHAPSSS